MDKSIFSDTTQHNSINGAEFDFRCLFVFRYKGKGYSDHLPSNFLSITNSGVNIFRQTELLLKPGRQYIFVNEKEDSNRHGRRKEGVIKHFFIILDFEKAYSPIMPSRTEIDISPGFSEKLLEITYAVFAEQLGKLAKHIAKSTVDQKSRRSQIIECLDESVVHPSRSYGNRRGSPEGYCDNKDIEKEAIAVYSKYCPVVCVDQNGNSEIFESLSLCDANFYVNERLEKEALFKVYARSFGVKKWISVTNDTEYYFIDSLVDKKNVTGLYSLNDIYKERQILFEEEDNMKISCLFRGDYALIKNDIFNGSLYFSLPGNLPGSWKKDVASRSKRCDVIGKCPARVLINSNHAIVRQIEGYIKNCREGDGK